MRYELSLHLATSHTSYSLALNGGGQRCYAMSHLYYKSLVLPMFTFLFLLCNRMQRHPLLQTVAMETSHVIQVNQWKPL